MSKEFKLQIDTKIDTAVNAIESSDTKKYELQGKIDTLRKRLKESIAETHTKDEKITDDEWREIYESLPANLLAEFGINTPKGLQDFVLGKERLPDSEVKRIADTIINTAWPPPLYPFFEETIQTLSQYDAGEILYIVAKAGALDSNLPYSRLKDFEHSARVRDIFVESAKTDPYQAFLQWDKINHYPWALETLFAAAQASSTADIRSYVNYAKGLPDQGKIKILEIAEKKEKSKPILRLLLRQEFAAAKENEEESLIDKVMSDPALQDVSDVEEEWILPLATVAKTDLEKKIKDLDLRIKHLRDEVIPRAKANRDEEKETVEKLNSTLLDVEEEYERIKKEYKICIESLDEIMEFSIASAQTVVARNLYFQGKTVDEQNVRNEVQRIIETREQYRNIPIFSGRNVVLAAHFEQKKSDDFGDLNRFGKQALIDRIRQDGGSIDGVLRASGTMESLKDIKRKILEAVRTTPPPFTFVFQGHGGPNALYLSDGQTKGVAIQGDKILETEMTVKITTQELFEAYKIRQEKFSTKSDTPETRDIFIDGGCYNSNFVRNFYIMCDEANIQKPIFTGESEYGQYGYSEYSSRYGDRFFDILFNNNDTEKATLGNIMSNDSENENSNPSLYIPTEGNETMQLSQNKKDQTDEVQFA